MNWLMAIPFLVIFAASCSEAVKNEGILITGKFLNASGEKIIFRELDVDAFHDLDSIVLDKIGLFRFTHNSSDDGFYILKFAPGEQIILQTGKGEEVIVEADLASTPFSYTIKGSPGSEILREFYIQTRSNTDQADSLRSVIIQFRESPDFYRLSLSFDSLFMEIMESQKLLQKKYIQRYPGSLATLIILNYKFGLVPVLNIKDDFTVYQSVDSVLMKKYPSNKHVLFHHQRVLGFLRQEKENETLKK